jgi:hypothetical protein
VRRVPFKTTERRRLRDVLLFVLRAAVLALLAVAFARPFLEHGLTSAAGVAPAREVVILLDGSASMGYGDRWTRARDAVRATASELGPDDRATLVLFSATPAVMGPPTGDAAQLDAYLERVEPQGPATRFEPALDLARDLVEASALPRREVVLITDFQRSGWDGRSDVRLPPGTAFRPVSVGDEDVENLAVIDVTLQRTPERGGRVVVAARIANFGARDVETRVRLGTGEQALQEVAARVPANDVALVRFDEVALPVEPTATWVDVQRDALPVDDRRRFVLRPIPRIGVLVVEPRGAADRDVLYLRRALAIARDPAFVATVRTSPSPEDVRAADVVVLNDAPFPSGETGRGLQRFLEGGGGLLWALGPHAAAIPESMRPMLGRVTGQPVDRLSARGAILAIADYGHPIFAPFRESRGADYGAVRVYRYRRLTPPDSARVLAWTDDGGPMLAEAPVGRGRALIWASDFGNEWNDLVVHGVFLPTVHEAIRYLAGHREPPASYAVGQALKLDELGVDSAELVLEAPDGSRTPIPPAAGLYTLRPLSGGGGTPIAVNLDPAESDLAQLDRGAFLAAVTPSEGGEGVAGAAATLTSAERERRQRLWWYIALAALVVLVMESAIAGVRTRGIGA